MNKALLRQVILDQTGLSKSYHYAAVREEYTKVARQADNEQVIIISGVRRCGKSTLLHYVRSQMAEQDYFINFDDERLASFKLEDFQRLFEVFIELYGNQTHFYFDEIQNVLGWERFVRRLHEGKNKIYITGSNASMLSRELGTHLTGRYHQIELYPFSFNEYLQFNQEKINEVQSTRGRSYAQKLFRDYLTYGGFPGYLAFHQADYLKDLYQSILYRDIVARYKLNKVNELKEMAYFIASNVGKLASFGKIKQMLQVASTTTIKDYFYYLSEAYLAFTIQKFDFSVKRQMLAPKKMYFIDSAMAQIVGFRFSEDLGQVLENIVFLQLKRRQYEIYYFSNKHECDFLVREQGHITQAYQVTHSLSDPKTKQREMAGLMEAMATHQLTMGMILTFEEQDEFSINENGQQYKITVLPVWAWLLSDFSFEN